MARRHGDFAIVAVAALIDGKDSVRLGVGGMAGTPVVRRIAADGVKDAVEKLAAGLEGYEDLHASAGMRRDILRNLAPIVIAEAQTMRRVNKDQKVRIGLTLNGRKLSAETEPRMLLSDFLRHSLGATGTHVGCEHGVCGCCTVQIDGTAVRSCLTLAMQAEGRDVQDRGVARRRRRQAQQAAAGVPEPSRAAMRLLHARHPDVVHRFPRAQSETHRGGVARGAERPHLPLYRLCRHHGGAEGSCRAEPEHRRST